MDGDGMGACVEKTPCVYSLLVVKEGHHVGRQSYRAAFRSNHGRVITVDTLLEACLVAYRIMADK